VVYLSEERVRGVQGNREFEGSRLEPLLEAGHEGLYHWFGDLQELEEGAKTGEEFVTSNFCMIRGALEDVRPGFCSE